MATQGSLGQLTIDLVANTAGFERGMNQAERALASATRETKKQGEALDRLIGQIDPTVAAYSRLDKMEQQLEAHRKAGRLPTEDYKVYLAQLNATRDALGKNDAALGKAGMSAKATAAALRGVPAQFTDIAVSLQAGQAPLTVLLQQGGQLKDMFGGIGPAAAALGGYVVGLINPFTILAATLGTITALFIDAEKEASAFNKALFSGSASSGQTASSLDQLSKDASTLTGRIGEARQAVIALAGSTGLSETQFRNLAIAATSIGEFTGKGAGEVAKSLGDMGDNATKAAQKISSQYGLITSEQYNVIKALDDQGKKQEALDVLSSTLAENSQKRLQQYRSSLSDIERDWNDIGSAISNAYAKVRGELFPDSAKQIEIIERILKTRKDGGLAGAVSTGLSRVNSALGLGTGVNDDSTENLEKQLALLKQAELSKKESARTDGDATRANQARIKADTEWSALATKELSDQKKLVKDIADARRLGVEAGKSQAQIDEVVAGIQAKYDKSQEKPKAYREDAGMKMLDSLRQQAAALQLQSETNEKLGTQAKALAAFEQQIADIKSKDIQTADQKSLLASEELLRAQLKRNVALEQEVAARKQAAAEEGKLQAFQENLNSKNNNAQDSLNSNLEGVGQGSKLRERLKEDLAIRKDYQTQLDQLQSQLNKGQISEDLYAKENDLVQEALAERLVMQEDYYNQVDEMNSNALNGITEAWANYSEEATNYQQQAADATSSILSDVTNSVAANIESLIKGQQSIGDFFRNVALDMANAVIGALVKMAAQWLVYAAVQLIAGKTAQAGAATSLIANAQATAFQASLAAFASTAAIPIVGPFLAPAAAASAAAFAAPLVAGVATASLAGMAHDGIDSIPETGTWLLQKGERVTTAQTSAKLDKTLDTIQGTGTSTNQPGTVVNLIEDASKAGQTRTRLDDEGMQQVTDVFVSQIFGDGELGQAMQRRYALRGVGE